MRLTFLAAFAALFAGTLSAQNFATHPCGEGGGSDHSFISRMMGQGEQACEVRTTTFGLVNGHLNLKGQNGSVEVIGEDRSDIALEARVSVRAGSQSEAASIIREISIETGANVEAHGPKPIGGNKNWSVSFKLRVPHHLSGDLHTTNGGISLASLEGSITGGTTNGGLSFEHMAGDVHLSTTNGGINAKLDGNKWQGASLSAHTTNGGINVHVTPNYAAHLVASTTNGGTSVNVAGADQNGVHRRNIDTNLNGGGPTISFETTNGGISIN